MTIRIATGDDAENVLKVRREAVLVSGREYYSEEILQAWAPVVNGDNIKEQEKHLSDKDRVVLLAEIEGEIAGLVTLGISEALIKQCYVLPEYQGKGVASSLMKEIEKVAKSRGITALRLSSSLIALDFYEKIGYARQSEYDYTLPGELKMRCFIMEKQII